jgi:hypothetical protein
MLCERAERWNAVREAAGIPQQQGECRLKFARKPQAEQMYPGTPRILT